MINEPLVSVIVPNYNYAPFLKQRIDSVLAQDFEGRFELILLDDASTDDSREVLESYRQEPRVSCIEINSRNTGSPFRQWQRGLQLARGKYVWLAESDDYADPSFLSSTVSLLERHAGAVFCLTGSYRVDAEGRRLQLDYDRWGKRQQAAAGGYGLFDGDDYVVRNLYWRSYVYNASGVLFRREAALKADVSRCFSMRYSGDWLFWTELARRGQVIELYRKLNYFRYHPVSVSTQARRSGQSLEEDMAVVARIEACYASRLGGYKRLLRRGVFYKRIKRLPVDEAVRRRLFDRLQQLLGGGRGAYLAERINKWGSHLLPWLPTEERERLVEWRIER